jgi:hypothetical protein
MLQERLATLEDAARPYIDSGYIVMGQTDSSLTLVRRRRRFSVLLFIILLILFWPAAIIYSVIRRTGWDESVCLRITSQGFIEVTGDALKEIGSMVSGRTFLLIVIGVIFLTGLSLFLLLR